MLTFFKRLLLPTLFVAISMVASAQTYDIIIDNRELTSNTTMEFDVFIKSNGSTGDWALRSYQCGYQFASAFVNGGTLSGSYVAGSSDLESTFGKIWGFTYNSAQFVVNQSANTGSLCPGALISTTARKIGRFRVTNTVNWGCADDNITIRTSGSGILVLAVSKYNSLDCSDVTNTLISSGATVSTSSPNESLLTASSSAPPSCTGNTTITVSATGGVSPYTGTGTFTVGNGTYNYTVTDNRGCTASTSIVINITPLTSSFSASGCSSYTLPWGTTVTSSGTYTNVYTSVQGCDSTVTANITIKSPSSSTTNQTICSSQLPYSWNGNSYSAAGTYSTTLTNAAGCDSIATLVLATNTPSTSPTSVSASSLSVTAGSSVILTVNGGSLGTGASWRWYTGSCGSGTSIGTGSPFTVNPSVTTTYFARAENVCGTSSCASVTISVTAASCTPSGITASVANNILCSGKTTVLTVQGTLSPGATWRWYRGTCGGRNSAGSGSSISVNPSSTTTYFVRQEGGTCGISGCASTTITVISRPNTPGNITGPTTGLCNGTSITFSIAPVPTATSYTWYVPAGSSIVSGQGTNSIQVNFGTSISSSSICVTASNQCGTSGNRCLSLALIPQIAGNITGPTTLATGNNGTYSVATAFGATSYTWTVPSGWQLLSGQGTTSIVAKAGTSGGYVRVFPVSTCGAGSTKSLTVKVSTARPGEMPETTAEPEITVWPVPATDVLFFKHNGVQPRRMEMFDSYGRMVMADGWITRLNLSNYASGIYFLKIYTRSGKVQTKRIEIIK